ncbi:MAG: hypothetical protein GX042_05515 [Bacteroidales bacterium]|nr:hypothetical protein [Bacteroidales bacterium]
MRYLRFILFAVLSLFYFFMYQGVLSHVIFYHEQHQLFLFSSNYFQQTLQTEGVPGYITNFVIQFFYIHQLGSAILALILGSVYLLLNQVIRTITGRDDLLQVAVIPSLFLFFYTMPVDNSLKLPVAVFVILLLLNILILISKRLFKRKKYIHIPPLLNNRLSVAVTVVLLFSYAGYGYYHFMKSYNVSEHIMVKAEQHARSGNWEKVLEYTGNYLGRGRSNQLISYFHNLALYHKGELPYRLFDHPQALGVESLYFPWNSDSRESEYGYMLYEKLGYINEAHRWEFEAMVVWGETAPHLMNLARYNLVNGRPLVAQRFINILKQSLFYRDEATKMEEGSDEIMPSLPHNSLKNVVDSPARFANVLNIGPELQHLLEKDPTNQMAFEYLMSQLLLSNHVERFAKSLRYIRNFSYTALPATYEEALYIYQLGVSSEEFAEIGFTVSDETKRRFARYYELVQANETDKLNSEFGSSYWYYLNYISPYGNKVITDDKKMQ